MKQTVHDVIVRDFDRRVSVVPITGCWLWLGSITAGGYGFLRGNGRNVYAHRAMFEHYRGPIPQGMQIDHLCRNRWCCNPDHLEAVDQRTNLLRGVGVAAKAARVTHCPHGHPYAGANLKVALDKGRERRICRACVRQHDRNSYLKSDRYAKVLARRTTSQHNDSSL